jgi:hypothetical protein
MSKVMNQGERQPDERESRGAVALTVAWMLTCMSTAAGLMVVLALRLLIVAFPMAAERAHPLGRVAGVLLAVAMITGLCCVALTPLIYRVRHSPPPKEITVGAVLIGIGPIVLMIVLNLLQ